MEDESSTIDSLKSHGGVNDAEVQAAIDQYWNSFLGDATLQKELRDENISVDLLKQYSTSPINAKRPEAQFGVAETILVSVAGGVAKDAVIALWNVEIWPYVKGKFGTKLER